MSRLDSFIRRLEAQRRCLGLARERIPPEQPGFVFELGLGNGRTYDHLRELFPEREIYAFERQLAAHPDSVPDEGHLFLGDFLEVLPGLTERFRAAVVLVHADIGSGHAERDATLAAGLGQLLAPFLLPGALVVSDRALGVRGTEPLELPPRVPPGRYFVARMGPGPAAGRRAERGG